MKPIQIGPGVSLNVAKLVAGRLMLTANSGAGKTRTLRRLLEQSFGTVQHIVIDPEGEFHTLRERFDYVLAAPKGGDTAAHPRTAALLAQRLLELGASAILDIYDLDPYDRELFVARFLDAMLNADRKLWHPVLVVLDEAHVYSPEGGKSESSRAVRGMASRGRKRGFALIPATQRLAKLSKDVAAECNNLLIGRCTLDVDIKRASEFLGFTSREDVQSLRLLEPGQFYAFGPAFDLNQPKRVRAGDVATTHPEAGSGAAPTPPPTSKVKALLPQLADLPAEAEEREKTVETLKSENAQLRRALTVSEKAGPAVEVRTVEKFVLKTGELDRAEKLAERATILAGELAEVARTIAAGIASTRVQQTPGRAETPVRQPSAAAPLRRALVPSAGTVTNGNLAGGERKILTALAQYPEGRSKTQVAILTAYAHSGGGFNNYISALRSKGYLDGSGDRLRITDAGMAALGHYDPLPMGRELLEHWLRQLGKAERLILEHLASSYPASLSKEALGRATGYEPNGGGFNNALSRLRSLELIEGRGDVRASAALFD